MYQYDREGRPRRPSRHVRTPEQLRAWCDSERRVRTAGRQTPSPGAGQSAGAGAFPPAAGTPGDWYPRERREKKIQREKGAADNALTFRQRLGVSLSKLSQEQLDRRVLDARPTALVRFADQVSGRPEPAEEDEPEDNWLATLTREQRAIVRSWIDSQEDDES